ncbi:MAG TPA: N-acetylglucosamine kinase [Cyclobacteriaceae bacterium]|jgi:glucosamine kinase|nr:N-acetylglucosamine kinase [Cytophagales bacterium]HMR57601.1 N-acetylglucosamine kinase [Cyclobacteriaceae bacterium]HRE67218.1 N-acetylglucosamine kinase [Cyclobacteriaceae bacterium]HRF35428.1 N-acetylglucosamine kinase [Cyclobacteriaceae bacterium]
MFLIADSGSSKTEWRLISEDSQILARVQTVGLNPYFLSYEKIVEVLYKTIQPLTETVDNVYFYGAGCGLSVKAEIVKRAILETIKVKKSCEVEGDMLGTARSVLKDKSGVACILGTGANSCVYNGQVITENIPSLGYILSDWGSGSVLGKDFISLILQEKLPPSILEDFHNTFQLNRAGILDSIYKKSLPNRFLASFAPFLLKYSEEPMCREIITSNFRSFFEYYVLRYSNLPEPRRISFTGSIAFNFRAYLHEVAGQMGIAIDEIQQNPMNGLIRYHTSNVIIL